MDVIELFAGVGGFRVGLERVNAKAHEEFFKTIWSNQFEPTTQRQHAFETYAKNFQESVNINKDIALVETREIPNADILCGGFPCQDYSVARTLNQSKGLYGKKGILWWQIERICREKGKDAPNILLLENVDRLVQSPASQRGRDFAMILQSLADLHYSVEWRIINAADYGMPQRRRRTYILAYKEGSSISNQLRNTPPEEWLFHEGIFAQAFPLINANGNADNDIMPFRLKKNVNDDLVCLSRTFNEENKLRPFCNAGIMKDGMVWTKKAQPSYEGVRVNLGDILVSKNHPEYISEEFYIKEDDLPKWQEQKGAKRLKRTSKNGHKYIYSEGGMAFPDSLDKPSRTIVTGEGGSSPSRFKHVIKDPVSGRFRRLVPVELERLDMFPDNWTEGQVASKRAFFMGNALVCGIVTKIGEELYRRLH